MCARDEATNVFHSSLFFGYNRDKRRPLYQSGKREFLSPVVLLGASWFRLQIVDTPSNTAEGKGDETIHARFE